MQADASTPPAPDRLTSCPDCGGRVSTLAPVCIHCGRPLAPAAPPASAPPKPMGGIVTVGVLGLISIAWALNRPTDSQNPDIRDLQQFAQSVQVLGNSVLLIGALLSLAGERRGNAIVRAASVLTIGGVLLILLMGWQILSESPDLQDAQGAVAALMAVSGALWLAPWLLYLYLFRRSRYP